MDVRYTPWKLWARSVECVQVRDVLGNILFFGVREVNGLEISQLARVGKETRDAI
jgi:hypothetical protein